MKNRQQLRRETKTYRYWVFVHPYRNRSGKPTTRRCHVGAWHNFPYESEDVKQMESNRGEKRLDYYKGKHLSCNREAVIFKIYYHPENYEHPIIYRCSKCGEEASCDIDGRPWVPRD